MSEVQMTEVQMTEKESTVTFRLPVKPVNDMLPVVEVFLV